MKGFKWELMQLFLSVFEPDLKIEIFFEKRGQQKKAMLILK